MTGRNEPCPCGSGLKFKKCHGDADASQGARDPLMISLNVEIVPRPELRFSESVLKAVKEAPAVAQNVTFLAEWLCRTFGAAVRTFPRVPPTAVLGLRLELERLRLLHGKRIAELIGELVPSVNGGRLAAAALLVRAALETTALLVGTEQKMTEALEAGVRLSNLPQELSPLFKATGGTRFLWEEYLATPDVLLAQYGKGKKSEKDRQVPEQSAATNVITLLQKLDRFLAESKGIPAGFVMLHYDLLSEFCHPNRGAFGIYGDASGDGFDLTVGPATDDARAFVARIVLPAAMIAIEPAVNSLNQLGALASSIGEERVH
jgi:hypothetical protein